MTTDDEGPCTDCGDTGVTFQTERRCACQPPESTDDKLAVSQEAVVDSGMDAETVATAEWLWTSLPTGPRKWTSLLTHEKALVCHTVSRFEAQARAAGERAGMEKAAGIADRAATFHAAGINNCCTATADEIASAILKEAASIPKADASPTPLDNKD